MLAEIESAELGQAQAALISARAHAEAATANEKREKELAEAHISSNREAELAGANAVSARAELVAAEQRVRALGGSPDGTAGILRLASPIAGKVIERNVSRGQSVEATHTAFRVADLSRVWIQLAVFERQLAAIHKGDQVDLSPQSDAERKVKGNVAYVGDVIDLETRTAPVRVVVDHPEVPLRPGQSLLAKIHTSAPVAASLVVPRDAVIERRRQADGLRRSRRTFGRAAHRAARGPRRRSRGDPRGPRRRREGRHLGRVRPEVGDLPLTCSNNWSRCRSV